MFRSLSQVTVSRRFAISFSLFSGFIFAPILAAHAQLPAPANAAPVKKDSVKNEAVKSENIKVEIKIVPAGSTPGAAKTNSTLPAPATTDDFSDHESTENAPAEPGQPNPKPETRNPKPLSIGGVSIRGKSYVAAIQNLRAEHDDKLRVQVELWDGKRAHRLRRSALGASIPYYKLLAQALAMSEVGGDVPLRYEVNLEQTERALKVLAGRINHAPANAALDIDAAGKVLLSGGEGQTLSIGGSALRIKAALESDAPKNAVELVVARQTSANDLEQFKFLLGEYSTPYDAGIVGRTTNLKMAAKLVDGEVVAKGKVFSTNLAIGPRNAAAGWKEAKMFVSGQVVNGVGAGICQCATTIYNAALLANLPIVERHPHSFRVNYAPASRDATLYWGQKDFKFRNNTAGPIYVQTMVKGERFHVRLYGIAPVKAEVAVESKVLSENKGTRSEAYRIVEVGGKRKREFLSRDYYRPKAR